MMVMVTAAMMTNMMGDDGNNDSSGGQRAMAVADGMVWGRRQAVQGAGNGNKAEMGTIWV
jgi:hypothetical protein